MPGTEKKKSHGKKKAFVRALIHELTGYNAYEKRAMELLKSNKKRTARKFLKKRLGSQKQTKRRIALLEDAIRDVA